MQIIIIPEPYILNQSKINSRLLAQKSCSTQLCVRVCACVCGGVVSICRFNTICNNTVFLLLYYDILYVCVVLFGG